MSDITKILGEIDKLKDKLDKKYSKKITIMFTDLKDSTVYFEKHGDMSGRMLIEKHNSILFPIIESYGGVIIKTIGDAIMAKFDFALNASKASIEMQRALKEYNETARDRIRIRIGIHTGKAIVEENDVFGDAVNLAARIEAGTEAEFITISSSTLNEIAAYKNIKVAPLGVVKYKGKEEEIETFSILWDSSILEKKVRGEKTWLYDSLLVKVTLENNKIKVRYRYYLNDNKKEEIFENIDKRLFSKFLQYLEQLRSSTLQKNSTTFDLDDFKKEGEKIYNELFSISINEIFKNSDLKYLVIDTDNNFSFLPFELLYDGKEFLGLKYPIFRLIDHFKKVEPEYSYFTFVDYSLDKEVAQEKEFSIINKIFEESNLSIYSPKKEYAELNDLRKVLSGVTKKSSHLHFAFHNLFSINFDDIKLKDTSINYKDILKDNHKLRYIIANSCKTVPLLTKFIDRENNFLSFLNNAELKLFLGNFFNIYDEVGLYFSEIFYNYMLKGYSYPEAVFKSKLKLKDKYGEDSLIWASYAIFADSVEVVLETMIDNIIKAPEKTPKIEPILEVVEPKNKENIRGTSDSLGGLDNTVIPNHTKTKSPTNASSLNTILLVSIILLLIGGVGLYIYKNNSNNSNNPAVVTKDDDNRKDDSTTTPLKKKIELVVDKKEDLIVYNGIQQSDIKANTKNDDKIAIKNTEKNNRLAVLYFDNNSNNKNLDPLRKALADMLIADISDVKAVNVVEREKLEDIVKELNLSKTKYIDKATALKIGRMLSAKYIMIGSFIDPPIEGLPLRVDAKIIDVETSEIKWAKGVTGDKKDLYKMKDKLMEKFKKSKFVLNFKGNNDSK
jgi:class 3 adenylate cyclase/TolB-like protein